MRLAALALGLFFVVGCSAPDEAGEVDVGREADDASVPAYTLTKDETTSDPALGLRIRGVSVSTNATSKEELEAVTRELWSTTRNADALIAAYYPDESEVVLSGTGYAFEDREAARAVLSSQYADPPESGVDEQVEKAMANGGISVLPIRDAAEER